eukprot:TRINITY_DN2032_c2_g2_i2.p1 TRINITY_DN2032_c2_g2~~TRINITY_DN2032_c2_g2_i2.p1  ORF type:complete len:885 (+),score=98.00 TRINITY_DN2032_c2_g2_i2:35-2656(+)
MNWDCLTDMPYGITGESTAIVYEDKTIYFFSDGGDSLSDVTVQMYDPDTDSWEIIDPSPSTRTEASVAIFRNLIYVIGGVSNGNPTNTVRIFDPETNKWSDGPSLPSPIKKAAVAVADKLYVIGGKKDNSWLGDMTTLTGPDSKWDTQDPGIPNELGKMPYPSAFIIGGYIWLIGENYQYPGPDQLVFLYDLYQGVWDSIKVEGLATPRARYSGCSTAVTGNGKGNLFLFGGIGMGTTSSTNYADLLQASIYPVISRNATHDGGYYVGDTLEITITQVSPASMYTFRISSTPSCEDNAGGTVDKSWDGYKNQVKFYPVRPVEEAYLCFSAGRCPATLRRSCSQHLLSHGLEITRSSCAGIGCCWDESKPLNPCFHKEGEDPGTPRLQWMTLLLWGEPFPIIDPPNGTDAPKTGTPGTPSPQSEPTNQPQTAAPGGQGGGKLTSDDILLMLVIICMLAICACGFYGITLRKKKTEHELQQIEVGDDSPTRYTILKKLGSGGYGYVFSVRRKSDGKVFAMKYIIVDSDEERRDAITEFETMKELQGHPNIVNLVDMFMSWSQNPGVSDEVTPTRQTDFNDAENLVQQATMRRYVCIVMEYHEHGDLKTFLIDHKGPLQEATVWYIASEVTSALQYMHSQVPPVMHRDLKPENLLISNPGCATNGHPTPTVVITDLGLARGMSEQTYCQTQAGSLPYVAPECWQRRYSVKIDMWALGCILYAACTMRVHSSNTRVMFSDVTKLNFSKELLVELSSHGYSRELGGLILSLLNPDPHVRPSAEDCHKYTEDHLMTMYGIKTKQVDFASLQRDLLRKKSQRTKDMLRPVGGHEGPAPVYPPTFAGSGGHLQDCREDESSEGTYLLQSSSCSSSSVKGFK